MTALSLIMCTLGRTESLWRLLESLQLQAPDDFELVIVDQNSEGYLREFVAAARTLVQVRYLRSRPGLSRARNVGIADAAGELVAFPDDDAWYPPGLVEKVISRFAAEPDLDVMTCRTVDADGRDSNGRFLNATTPITRRNVWYAGNSNGVFARSKLVKQLGGFNEELGVGAGTRFGSGEESDLILRALARGAIARFDSELFVHHDQVDVSLGEAAFRRGAAYARGLGRTLRLNQYGLSYAMYRSLRSLAAAGGLLLRSKPERAKMKGIWASGILRGYLG